MPSNLHQLQLTYNLIEDRLLLTFFTHDYCEYRFWITRHLVKGLWDTLQQFKKADLTEGVKDKWEQREEERLAESQVKKESTQAQASKYTTKINQYPLGEVPLLLYKLMVKPEEGLLHFRLENLEGKFIEFSADRTIIALLSQLIFKAVGQTDWELTQMMSATTGPEHAGPVLGFL